MNKETTVSNCKTHLNKNLADWLFSGEPWVIYRTLTDILDAEEDDRRVLTARKNVLEHKLIRRILDKRNLGGYWGVPQDIHTWWPKKDTTLWVLGILGDFGLRVEDEELVKATEYVFSIQQKCGGFLGFDPRLPYDCHTAILTESLVKVGLLSDGRVQRAYDWLLGRQRRDGGWWCKNTGQIGGPREKELSCAMATMLVLVALAQNPRLRDSEAALRGVNFLFGCWENKGKIKYAGHDSQVGTDWEKLKYPFTDYKILKFLDVLFSLNAPKKGFGNQKWSSCSSQNETTKEGSPQNQSLKSGPILTLDKKTNLQGGSHF